MRTIQLIDVSSLDPELARRWDAIQRANPALQNPFLCPEFVQAAGAVRDDVEIAVLKEDGEVQGFFPFARSRDNNGVPVGNHLSNRQALLVREDGEWDARQILSEVGLSTWTFDNLVASQAALKRFHYLTDSAHFIDLSQGFQAYLGQRRLARP